MFIADFALTKRILMKQQSIFIGIYAVFLIIGGLIGYYLAGSLASIFMSATFALLLLGCSISIWKGNRTAYYIAASLVFCLLLFFSYRFFTSFKIAPAGLMMLISGALLIGLAKCRPRLQETL
jgi:uncharacterized membrane protein (UPF0136 family)